MEFQGKQFRIVSLEYRSCFVQKARMHYAMAQIQKHCSKYRDFMLKCSIYRQMLIGSKAEMFIHVAIQNLVFIHRAQENSWRTDISDQGYFQPL